MGKLEYNGRPNFSRKRKLVDTGSPTSRDRLEDRPRSKSDDREVSTDSLYRSLAKVYLKGNKLKKALADMEPAQYIPIEGTADSTHAAASRLDDQQSKGGTIITYSMYQNAIDNILAKKWEIRGTYLKMEIPASVESETKMVTEKLSGSDAATDIIKEFLSQNGIAGTILSMLTLAPFQSILFQSLTTQEAGTRAVSAIQIPAGIALFLELGIKAERIIALFKQTGVFTPLVEQQTIELESSPDARSAALSGVGIDYNELKKSQSIMDSENIMNYVSEYYARYGGLAFPGSHLTIDHWLAYLHVAQNQQSIRGCLNTASTFSPEFRSYQKQFTDPQTTDGASSIDSNNDKTSKISIQLASATRALRETSNDIYDDILRAFTYQITDRDMCCLVQIFGAVGDTDLLKTLASILRILSVNLSGEFVRLDNILKRFLANLFQDAMFEVVSRLNEVQYQILNKITRTFTIEVEGLESCGGLFTLGWALLESVQVIFIQMEALLKDIISAISEFGLADNGSWESAADRRHLLGMARILEVLSARLELANVCDKKKEHTNTPPSYADGVSFDPDQAIFSLLEDVPPTIQISDKDKAKYFPGITNVTSSRLKYTYGTEIQQNNEDPSVNCGDSSSNVKIQDLIEKVSKALRETFNG